MRFHFITAVWGDSYVKSFLDAALPNVLTPGNLGAFAPGEAVFKIYTAPRDAVTISTSPVFKKLSRMAEVDMVEAPGLRATAARQEGQDHADAISTMNRLHQMAIREGEKEGAGLVCLSPDAVWSEGSFARMRELARSGRRVVAVAGIRLMKETFLPAFMERFGASEFSMPAPSRELVALAMEHLHPITKSLMIDSERFARAFPTQIYWPVGESGLLARAMHLHPMLVWPTRPGATAAVSFDSDFYAKACPDYRDYHVVTDSDEIAVFEFSAENKFAGILTPARFGLTHYASVVRSHAEPVHRRFMSRKIRIHSGEINGEWDEAERASGSVVRRALFISALWNAMPNVIREPMDHVKRVVIFGAGAAGKLACALADKCGWEVAYYVDNNTADASGGAGREVKKPDTLKARDYDLVIVASAPGRRAIFRQLAGMGMSYKKDFIYFQDSVCVGGFQIGLSHAGGPFLNL